jgi:hypothetical protein
MQLRSSLVSRLIKAVHHEEDHGSLTSSKLSIMRRVMLRKTTAGWCRKVGGASLHQNGEFYRLLQIQSLSVFFGAQIEDYFLMKASSVVEKYSISFRSYLLVQV